jgi:hypothetical protein
LARFAIVISTNAAANQPNMASTRGEKTRKSAISRMNRQPTAPLRPMGTFHANDPSGCANDSSGQSNPWPDK